MNSVELDQVRRDFAERIRLEAGIKSDALIRGLGTVPKEEFIGPGPWKIMRPTEMARGYQTTPDDNPRHLYDTILVALDAARKLNNGEPSGLIRWLDSLDLAPGERFLHIGCGVGYYTAVAAEAIGPEGIVVGVEIDLSLAARAETNLRGYPHVRIVTGDGSSSSVGVFDAVFVNAGCTHLPSIWLDQLAIGGRVLAPLTVDIPTPGVGAGFMLLVTRRESGYDAHFTTPVGIFHCVGARTDVGNTQLKAALAGLNHQAIRRLRRDRHVRDANCWLHDTEFCLSIS